MGLSCSVPSTDHQFAEDATKATRLRSSECVARDKATGCVMDAASPCGIRYSCEDTKYCIKYCTRRMEQHPWIRSSCGRPWFYDEYLWCTLPTSHTGLTHDAHGVLPFMVDYPVESKHRATCILFVDSKLIFFVVSYYVRILVQNYKATSREKLTVPNDIKPPIYFRKRARIRGNPCRNYIFRNLIIDPNSVS